MKQNKEFVITFFHCIRSDTPDRALNISSLAQLIRLSSIGIKHNLKTTTPYFVSTPDFTFSLSNLLLFHLSARTISFAESPESKSCQCAGEPD